ncbi:MAG TPA: D-alanyl-D-alanine carboxypeptidase family protein [Dehalococcoidia bacterium]|nr:D-alanyl-D-alanine carboxypeptidase family protein [Dehalococcoidia bacterium]
MISPLHRGMALMAAIALIVAQVSLLSRGEPAPASAAAADCGALAWATAERIQPVRNADAPPPPPVTAAAAVVVDGESGRVLYDLNAHERRAPASTTKIMTAIVALEGVSEDMWVVSDINGDEMVGSSIMGLRRGMYIQMRDLLYGLMLPSGNDAAVEIAKNTWGTEERFVEKMNEKVAELGLGDTHFENPHGLDRREHYSTAYDLAMIGRYAMGNEEFRRIVASRVYELPRPIGYVLQNGNTLLNKYPGADGLKIGWTDRAGWTLVASATRDGHRVFVTVLDSEDRDADASALLEWAFTTHQWKPVRSHIDVVMRIMRGIGRPAPLAMIAEACAVRATG